MVTWVKRISVGIGSLLLAFLAILGGVSAYIDSAHGRQWIQDRINRSIPGTVTWADSRVSLMSGRLELLAARLTDTKRTEIASFDRLYADISWLDLIKKQLTVRTLELDALDLRLRPDEGGRTNLVAALSPDRPSEKPGTARRSPFNLVLESARIGNGSVSYAATDRQAGFTLQGIRISAAGDSLSRSGRIDIAIVEGEVRHPSREVPLQRIAISGAYRDGNVEDIALKATVSSSNLELNGRIGDLQDTPLLDLEWLLRVPVADLDGLLGVAESPTGDVSIIGAISGPLPNPSGRLDLAYSGGTVNRFPVDRIHINLQLDDQILAIHRLEAKSPSGEVSGTGKVRLDKAFPNGFGREGHDLQQISYRLDLTGRNMRVDRLAKLPEGLQGEYVADLHLSGNGFSRRSLQGEASFVLEGEDTGAEARNDRRRLFAEGKADIGNGRINLDRFSAAMAANTIRSTGYLDLNTPDLSVDLAADLPDLGSLLSLFGIDEAGGRAAVRVHASGKPANPGVDIELNGNRFTWKDMSLGDLHTEARLEPTGEFRIAELTISNRDSRITAEGEIQLFRTESAPSGTRPLNLELVLKQAEFAHFLPKYPASGVINGTLSADGTIEDIRAKMSIEGEQVVYKRIPMGSISAVLAFSGGKLRIDKLAMLHKENRARIVGHVDLLDEHTGDRYEDPGFQIGLTATAADIGEYHGKLGGSMSLSAQAEGTISHPKGAVLLSGNSLTVYGQSIDTVELDGICDELKCHIKKVEILPGPAQSLAGTGWFGYDKSYQFSLRGSAIDLHRIEKLRDLGIEEGMLDMNVQGSGSLSDPLVEGTIDMAGVKIHSEKLDDIRLTVDVRDRVARVLSGPHREFSGTYHIGKKMFDASLNLKGTDLSPLFSLMGKPDLGAWLEGRIHVEGVLNRLSTYKGVADIPRLSLNYHNEPLIQNSSTKLVFGGERLDLEHLHLEFPGQGQFDLAGFVAKDGTLSVEGKGTIPVSIAEAFIEDNLALKGSLSADAKVKGSRRQPDIQIDADLIDIGAKLPTASESFHHLNGQIRLTSKQADIIGIAGQLGDGEFELDGRLEFNDRFQPGNLVLNAKADLVQLGIPDALDLLVNADLRLQGTPEQTRLSGQITMVEGVYYKDVNLSLLQAVEGKKKRKATPAAKDINTPYLKNMALDVTVKHLSPFLVENNIARLEIIPDLQLKGTAGNPLVNGRASVQSGVLSYQRKQFSVKKGVVDFVNPYEIEPTLDISGEANVKDWLISLSVSGTPNELAFALASDPPLEHGDILSLLVFGRTTGEMIEGEGGSTDSAAQILSQIFADAAGKHLKELTGLDLIDTDVGSGHLGSESGAGVTMGKKLSDRLMILYSVGSRKGEMIQRAVAEYRFLEDIVLSGFQNSKGGYGGSIKYRLNW